MTRAANEYEHADHDRDERKHSGRVESGIQCPECFGINVSFRNSRFQASPLGFQCEDCGCNWTKRKVLS